MDKKYSLECFRSTRSPFVKLCLWLTIIVTATVSCTELVDSGIDSNRVKEAFYEKSNSIAQNYDNSNELFSELVENIYDAYANDRDGVKKRLDHFKGYIDELELRASDEVDISQKYNGRSSFDAEMRKLATYDHIGNDFFFKLRALTILIEKENPNLDRSDSEQMNAIVQNLVAGASKLAEDPTMTGAGLCVLQAAEDANIAAEGQFNNAVIGMLACLWTGIFFGPCLATVVAIFGSSYYTIFTQLDTNISRCLADYPMEA
jgi:hypothetical protein